MVKRKDSVPEKVRRHYHGNDTETNVLGNSCNIQDPKGCFEVKAVGNLSLT